ncbi:tripeptidyl peptidase precursor [Sarocladium strictum]
MKLSQGIALWLQAGTAAAAVLEEVYQLPQGWQKISQSPDPDETILLSFAVRQPDIENIGRSMESKAASHLSREEARNLQKPCPVAVKAVTAWLHDQGITDTRSVEDFIRVRTTVGEAEALLNATINNYTYKDKPPVRRTQRYSVPDEVANDVAFVHPIANFMRPQKELTFASPLGSHGENMLAARDAPCSQRTTPQCIRQLYGINTTASAKDVPAVRFGIAGFLEENANYVDALAFLKRTAPEIAATGYNFSTELINGAKNEQNPMFAGNEAALDIQYALALAYPSNITYLLAAGRGVQLNDSGDPLPDEFVTNEPYLEFLEELLAKSDDEVPHVLSISYADDELSVPRPYAERVCSMLGLLTARGTTIFGGSGDGGARGARNSSCLVNDGSGRKAAMATFPATCPWVTSVGAVTGAEKLTAAGFSTGGFSQYFPRPDWQDKDVEGYVKALDGELDGLYNSSMRAIPDVSAIGTNFNVQVARTSAFLSGTSASTPVIASLIVLVNEARFKRGKQSLGWLNKVLYSDKVRSAFQDVTNGTSVSCQFEGEKEPGGWPTEKGWDAVTGLGVPKSYQKLLDVLLNI